MCDSCSEGWHFQCLPTPLTALPPADEGWQCPRCLSQGIPYPRGEVAAPGRKRPTPAAQRRDLELRAFTGRFVTKKFVDPSGERRPFWGVVTYTGPEEGRRCMRVEYEDGDGEDLPVSDLYRILQPEGTPWPKGRAQPKPFVK